MGCFGIGSKSALAPGAESFRMITVYNHKRYTFDIFNDRFFSTIAKFDNGNINKSDLWDYDGEQVEIFYENTDEYNSVTIEVEIKNPLKNKREYIRAVKDQLMYFKDISFVEYDEEEEGDTLVETMVHSMSAEILYKDHRIIIPKSSSYSRCHLILNGVNYGVIDFPEMELDDKVVCAGIIGDSNEVEVTPSRESLIYSTKTRNAMLRYIAEAEDIARNMLEVEVAENSDTLGELTYLLATSGTKVTGDRLEVLNRLKKLTGATLSSKLQFLGSELSRSELYDVLRAVNVYVHEYEDKENSPKIDITKHSLLEVLLGDVHDVTTIVDEGKTSFALKSYYSPPDGKKVGSMFTHYVTEEANDTRVLEFRKGIQLDSFKDAVRGMLIGALLEEAVIIDVESINVPEDFARKKKESIQKKKEAKEAKATRSKTLEGLSPAAKRALNKEVLVHFPKIGVRYSPAKGEQVPMLDIMDSSEEIPLKDLLESESLVVTRDDIPLLEATFDGHSGNINLGRLRVKSVSKEVLRSIFTNPTNCMPYGEYFRGYKDNKINLPDMIQKRTANRKCVEALGDCNFLTIMDKVDPSAYKAYMALETGGLLRNIPTIGRAEEVDKYVDTILEIQKALAYDEEEGKKVAAAAFGKKLDGAKAVDLELLAMIEALEQSVSTVKFLLSLLTIDQKTHNSLNENVEQFKSIMGFLKYVPYEAQLELVRKKYNLKTTQND